MTIIKERISNADEIVDKGPSSYACHYLLAKNKELLIIFYSDTFEILDVKLT